MSIINPRKCPDENLAPLNPTNFPLSSPGPGGKNSDVLNPECSESDSPSSPKKAVLQPSTKDNLNQPSSPSPNRGQRQTLSESKPTPLGKVVTPKRYELISELDKAETWKEEVTVVTRHDHELYTQTVRELLDELIDNLPLQAGLEEDLVLNHQQETPIFPVSLQQGEHQPRLSLNQSDFELQLQSLTLNEPVDSLPQPDLELLDLISEIIPNSNLPENENSASVRGPVMNEETSTMDVNPPSSPALPVGKGSYNFDWDNFDENSNPFETKSKVINDRDSFSVGLPETVPAEPEKCDSKPDSTRSDHTETTGTDVVEKDDYLTPVPDIVVEPNVDAEPAEEMQNSDKDTSEASTPNITSGQTSQETMNETANIPDNADVNKSCQPDELPLDSNTENEIPVKDSELPEPTLPWFGLFPDEIPLSKGSYDIDWDKFDDSVDPFETKSKVEGEIKSQTPQKNTDDMISPAPYSARKKAPAQNSPSVKSASPLAKETQQETESDFNQETTNETANIPDNAAVCEDVNKPCQPDELPLDSNAENEIPVKESPPMELPEPTFPDEIPLSKGSYDIDWDKFDDSVDPFETKSKVEGEIKSQTPQKNTNMNSPTPSSARKKAPAQNSPSVKFALPVAKETQQETESDINQNETKSIMDSIKDVVCDEVETSEGSEGIQSEASAGPENVEDSTDHPPQLGDDIPDEEFVSASEVFSDPASLDMLERCGSNFKESALARQSLYVKFDPLVEKNSPVKPTRKPSAEIRTESDDSLLLMGTPPCKSGAAKQAIAQTLEASIMDSLPEELCDASNANRQQEVDRLFSFSPQEKQQEDSQVSGEEYPDNADIVHVLKYSQADLNKIIQAMMLDFQAKMLSKQQEWQTERETLQVEFEKNILQLRRKVSDLEKEDTEMKEVMAEYELTITELTSRNESLACDSRQSMADLLKERDTAVEDLQSVETAFSDLHRRFEKSKNAIKEFKKNEETYKKCLSELQQKAKKQDDKYQMLKKHAEEKLDQANSEIDKLQKANQNEVARLQASNRRAEVQVNSLKEQVAQKVKENKELTELCDELISKVES